jgi:hypothetical protein
MRFFAASLLTVVLLSLGDGSIAAAETPLLNTVEVWT